MRISSVGKHSSWRLADVRSGLSARQDCRASSPVVEAGVTLIEMIVVVSLIAVLVGISFPSMASGIETLRLNSASDSVVAFINGGLNRAERRQVVVEVT